MSVPSRTVSIKPYALFFQALANQTRMQVQYLLSEKGGMSVSEICSELGLEQTHVSNNLKCLTLCGLVTPSHEGKASIYSINEQTVLTLLKVVDNHLSNYDSSIIPCA